MWRNSGHERALLFPRLINLSINDFSSAISYWFYTVAKVS